MLIGQSGALPADLIKDTTTDTFMADVMETSRTTPVIVDFWAPWCGPCKQLGPALEKLVKQYGGKVKLVKINVDENQELAMQFRVQSIPAVYGFKDGRPVDGFMGALPENQLKQFIERLTGGGGSPIDEALTEAENMLQAGENDEALALYQEVLDQDPANTKALAGVMRTHIALGQEQTARDLLAKLPEAAQNAADIASVRAILELQDQAAHSNASEIQGLEAKVEADPKDMQARLDLAIARFGAGDKQKAIDDLLEMVRRDRKWNDEAARKQLVKFFEAFGPADPLTRDGRRKLSAILFS